MIFKRYWIVAISFALFFASFSSVLAASVDLDSLILAPEEDPQMQLPISPTFDPAVTSYSVNVGYNITGVLIVPTALDPQATITVNGQAITAERFFYAASSLPTGTTTVSVVVTDEATTTKTYTIELYRQHFTKVPPRPTVRDGGNYTSFTDHLTVSWSYNPLAYPEAEIQQYQYAIGTDPISSQNDILDWTATSSSVHSVTISGLNLQNNRTYYLSVKALNFYGILGKAGSSDGITIDLDNPFAEIMSPVADSFVRGIVPIEVNTSDTVRGADGINKVEFFIDSISSKIGEDSTYPFSLNWNTTALNVQDGPHTIMIKSYDGADNIKEASVVVNVDSRSPSATNITVEPASYGAVMTLSSDEPVAATLSYGTSVSSMLQEKNNPDFSSAQEFKVYSLNPSATYYYQLTLIDRAGNETRTSVGSFVTKSAASSPSSGSGGGGGYQQSVKRLQGLVLGASTFRFTRDLKLGMMGEDVRELQNLLTKSGYFHGTLTGFFGVTTQLAVKSYQTAQKLVSTGVADLELLKRLGGLTASVDEQAKIDQLMVLVQSLIKQVLLLLSQRGISVSQ